MKPLHRCLKASLTTILLPIVFTSIELPGEQHTLPGSNTRENTLSHTHSIFPSLNVIFNVRFKYTPRYVILEWNDSRTPTRRFSFFFFFFFDEESWLIRTYHDYTDTPRTTNGDQRRLNIHWTVLRPSLA